MGGGYSRTSGRAGGSGIVVISYPLSNGALTVGAGLTFTQTTSGSNRVYTFTAGTGTVSW